MATALSVVPPAGALTDEQVVEHVRRGRVEMFELLMRRHNERLYRAVRAVLKDEAQTEDVMQEAYLRAYSHLGDFAGLSRFSTWLTRIAVHEALWRSRRAKMAPVQVADLTKLDPKDRVAGPEERVA